MFDEKDYDDSVVDNDAITDEMADSGEVLAKKKRIKVIIIVSVVAFVGIMMLVGTSIGGVANMVSTGDANQIMNGSVNSEGWSYRDGEGSSSSSSSGVSEQLQSTGSSSLSSPLDFSDDTTSFVDDKTESNIDDVISARKVVRGAELGLFATNFNDASSEIDTALKQVNATIMSDETQQYGDIHSKNEDVRLVRVLYAEVPTEHLNAFIDMCSNSVNMKISSRRVSMTDVTDQYKEDMESYQKTLEEIEKELIETQQKLEAETDETEQARLKRVIETLENRKESETKAAKEIEDTVDTAELSLVLQGSLMQGNSVDAKRHELNQTINGIPDALAIAGLSFIIGVIHSAPVLLVLAIVGGIVWFFYKKQQAAEKEGKTND